MWPSVSGGNRSKVQSAGQVPGSVLVGRWVYLGPLFCNFFVKTTLKALFERTNWPSEIFEWVSIRFRKISINCIFWLVAFISYCFSFSVAFLWLFQVENAPEDRSCRKTMFATKWNLWWWRWCCWRDVVRRDASAPRILRLIGAGVEVGGRDATGRGKSRPRRLVATL
jgi:hypothetical protein